MRPAQLDSSRLHLHLGVQLALAPVSSADAAGLVLDVYLVLRIAERQ
jgi:hypothetical protein